MSFAKVFGTATFKLPEISRDQCHDRDSKPASREQWHAQVIAVVELLVSSGRLASGDWPRFWAPNSTRDPVQASPIIMPRIMRHFWLPHGCGRCCRNGRGYNALLDWKRRAPEEGRTFTKADLYGAIMEGAVDRVRPKMMNVAAIMAGILPILWSTGFGSEVMQRIAVPMIGGMVSSTLLTLIVIPLSSPLSKAPGCGRARSWKTIPTGT